MKLRALLPVLCVALPGAAFAQPYFSANVGWGSGDFPLEAPVNGFVDDGAPTYGIDIGIGVRQWAFELGVSGYGNFDGRAAPCAIGAVCTLIIEETSLDQTIYDAALVRRFYIKNLEMFGKAGYYKAKLDTDIPIDGSDLVERGLMLGIGARWYFRAPWSVSIEGTRYDDNVSQLSVGFGWGLGFKDEDQRREEERERNRRERERETN
jgi:hypothetical protein